MNAFHAYDIRGVYNRDFDKHDAYLVGFFMVEVLGADRVLVGRDVRLSSNEIFEHLTRGITDAGADVYDLGLATTPMVYYATAKGGFRASAQITASHNPKEYNGLKISRQNAEPVGYDTGLRLIEEKMRSSSPIPVAQRGRIVPHDIRQEYVEFLNSFRRSYDNLKIGIDCSNGMAALLIKDILGQGPIYLYDELDGTFPNHEANPLIPENVADLQRLVTQYGCDLGVIFDGDADRVMFVDERGRFISPDLMIGLLGLYFLDEKGLRGNVLQDIRTSKAVGEYLTPKGATMHTWRVGRAYAAKKLREIDGIYGGELAGHYYFRDFFYSDSGLLACILILNIASSLKANGVSLSQAIAQIGTYANAGEINFRVERKQEAMDAMRKHFTGTEQPTASMDFDGYRVEFADWWFNIRPSNTEPYLRFIAEAKCPDMLRQKVDEAKAIVAQFE